MESLSDAKEKIKDRADLAHYIAKHTKLVKSNQGFKACCPLPGHKEKSPSFYVNTRDNYFYCYGCNRGGDIFSFLKLVEGLEFIEALKELAADLNIELPQMGSGNLKSEGPLQKSRKDKGFEILNRAALFFNRMLIDQISPGATQAYEYLRGRGISDNEMMDWGLGWAPAGGQVLLKKLKGDEEFEIAQAVGLVRQYGQKAYDFFQDRLMIPIRDVRGRTVAFSGRSLLPVSENNPKYKNSPETDWFKKKETLYGLDLSQKLIRDENFVCFVEGYFDQWAFLRKRIPAVAVMGTALSDEHLQSIVKHTKQVVLVLDVDQAGVNSTKRSLPLLLQKNFDVKIFSDMAGKDPDEWLKEAQLTEVQIRTRLLGAPEALEWWGRLVIKESADQSFNRLQTLKALEEVWVMARSIGHKSILADEWGRILGLPSRDLANSLEEMQSRRPPDRVHRENLDVDPARLSQPAANTRKLSQSDRLAEEIFVFWVRYWELLLPKSHEAWEDREKLFKGTVYETVACQMSAEARRGHGDLSQDFLRGQLANESLDPLLRSSLLKGLVSSELALPEDATKILNSFAELSSALEKERVGLELRRLQGELRSHSHDLEKTAQLLHEVQGLRMNLEKRK